jgi:CBS domain-containing protein
MMNFQHSLAAPAANTAMNAADVMVRLLVTVAPDAHLSHAINLMIKHRVGGLPVVDADGKLVGMLSEGDLLHRAETGTGRHRPRWLEMLRSPGQLAQDYVHEHGRVVSELMSTPVVSVSPDTPIEQVIRLMEKKRIKRVPVLRDGRLDGMVSRANLMQVLLRVAPDLPPSLRSDEEVRAALWQQIADCGWIAPGALNIVVSDGVVQFHGIMSDLRQQDALRVLAENTPGVREVHCDLLWCDSGIGLSVVTPGGAGP